MAFLNKINLRAVLDRNTGFGTNANSYGGANKNETANVKKRKMGHPINENSPLYQFTKEDFDTTDGEILIFVKTFDDMFSNTVATRTSYTFDEVIYGAKFVLMYKRNADNSKTVLDLDKLNQYEHFDL